ncbi:MAG: Rho termination factor N-terminal domain-containing protein [Thermoleophilaceae bacterium]|nr:Rho termination factor N-terminal domain-containing protein [Thermoleophilaceae bacterium]
MLDRKELEESPLADLHAIAAEVGVEGYRRLRRAELIAAILGETGGAEAAPVVEDEGEDTAAAAARTRPRRARRAGRARAGAPGGAEVEDVSEEAGEAAPEGVSEEEEREEGEVRTGTLDILPNGSGFMRADPFAHSRDDVYVSPAQIRRCELRAGDEITGPVRPPRRAERYPSLIRVDAVNGGPSEPPAERPRFEDLTPVFPTERLPAPASLDAAPFGKGSRVAIAGEPGSGVTSILRELAKKLSRVAGIEAFVVLAGVRPEEVTEWRRESGLRVAGGGYDAAGEQQTQAAEMALELAKRAVERGGDAVLLVDALDVLPAAVARRVFGSARKAEEGGSLTVIAAVGDAREPLRVATTRIVLESPASARARRPKLAPASGTTRADLLS